MSSKMSPECYNVYNVLFSISNDTDLAVPTNKKFEKSDAVREVRSLLNIKTKTVSVPDLEDHFILRFLHSRKMDVDSSFQLILNYFAFRQNSPHLFENLNANDEILQNSFQDGLLSVLKNRDRKGRCVLFLQMYQMDLSKYTVETIYRSLMISMEYLLSDEKNQIFGFVFIVDWSGFKFRDYVDISPRLLKLLIDGFQDSFPARIRGVHFIGQPWYVNGVLTVVKPFLKEKTKQKLVIHGANLSGLHEYLPLDVLTSELGGEGTAYRADEWIEILKNYENRLSEV